MTVFSAVRRQPQVRLQSNLSKPYGVFQETRGLQQTSGMSDSSFALPDLENRKGLALVGQRTSYILGNRPAAATHIADAVEFFQTATMEIEDKETEGPRRAVLFVFAFLLLR